MDTELPSPVRLADPKAQGTDGDWFGAMNHSRVSVGAGAAGTWDLGLGGPAWSATLWGGFRPTRGLTLWGRLTALGSATTVAGPTGSADVHRDMGSVGLAWTFARVDHIDAFVTVAGGMEQLRANGVAPSPAMNYSQGSWSPVGLGGAGVRVHLTNRLALVLAGEGLVSLRRQVLVFDDVQLHPLSRPGISIHAGIEASTF